MDALWILKIPYWKALKDPFAIQTKEPEAAHVLETNRETPVKCNKGIRLCSSKKLTRSIGPLKCLHSNAYSMGNRQEKMEATVHLERYDLIATTEIC